MEVSKAIRKFITSNDIHRLSLALKHMLHKYVDLHPVFFYFLLHIYALLFSFRELFIVCYFWKLQDWKWLSTDNHKALLVETSVYNSLF